MDFETLLNRYEELAEIVRTAKLEMNQIRAAVEKAGGVETRHLIARIELHEREQVETLAELKRKKRYDGLKRDGLIHKVRVRRFVIRRKV